MRKILIVAFQQIKQIVWHWSFLLLLLFPLIYLVTLGVTAIVIASVVSAIQLAHLEFEESPPAPGVVITNTVEFDTPVGLVDEAGLIVSIPDDIASENLTQYSSAAAAQAAIQRGEIAGYYQIPPDFLDSGFVNFISRDNTQFTATDQAIKTLLVINLARADSEAAGRRAVESASIVMEILPTDREPPPGGPAPLSFRDLGALGSILFLAMTFGSGTMTIVMAQVAREGNRGAMEMMLETVSPLQLLAGKYIGLILISSMGIGLWVAQGWLIARGSLTLTRLPSVQSFDSPRQIEMEGDEREQRLQALVKGIQSLDFNLEARTSPNLYLQVGLTMLGASLSYTGVAVVFGAIVNDYRQSSRLEGLLGYFVALSGAFAAGGLANRGGPWAIFLSLCPLTSPVSLPVRLLTAQVADWEVLLSFGLSVGWASLLVWVAAKLFQARLLLEQASVKALVWQWARRSLPWGDRLRR